MTLIGLQIILLVAAALAVLLIAYSAYIRFKQTTYTEKRFSFVALWACVLMVISLFATISNSSLSPWSIAFSFFGIPSEPLSFGEKTLCALVVVFFVWRISLWAENWNGQLTKLGLEAQQGGVSPSIFWDGISETARIVRRLPPLPACDARKGSETQIPIGSPLVDLPFHEQVREISVAIWPEFIFEPGAWTAEASAWLGTNTALGEAVLLVCSAGAVSLNASRLIAQIQHEQASGQRTRVIIVTLEDKGGIEKAAALREACSDIEVLTFDDLISRAVRLDQYRREIVRQFEEQPLPNATFSIGDVFTPLNVRDVSLSQGGRLDERGEPITFESYVASWLKAVGMSQLALLGDYGQGKTTAALALTHKLLTDAEFFRSNGSRIPILIRLTGQSPKTSSAEELLSAWGGRFGINGRALLALHRSGRTCLIFDAFDEMANVTNQADRIDHFAALWQFACPSGKVIFTGRPNFFLDDEELKGALRVAESNAAGAYCKALRVQAFTKLQIEDALGWLGAERSREFMKAVNSQKELADIVQRPSLLFQVAQLWNLGQLNLDGPHLRSAGVILQFVSYSLDRQVEKQAGDVAYTASTRQFLPLRRSELEYFLTGCAVVALTGGRNNSLPAAIFRTAIAVMLEEMPEARLAALPRDVGSLTIPLKDRIPDLEKRIEACTNSVRTHGILELDPAKGDHYKFSHKSFAEALAARAIVSGALQSKDAHEAVWRTMDLEREELLGQKVIFSFVRDVAVLSIGSSSVDGVGVFQGLTGIKRKSMALVAMAMESLSVSLSQIVYLLFLLRIRFAQLRGRKSIEIQYRSDLEKRLVKDVEDIFFAANWADNSNRRRRVFPLAMLAGAVMGGMVAMFFSAQDEFKKGFAFLVPATVLLGFAASLVTSRVSMRRLLYVRLIEKPGRFVEVSDDALQGDKDRLVYMDRLIALALH